METALALCLGLGLAAACGFRVFVPPLVIAVAARAGYLHLAGSWEWMASTPALIVFGTATLLEVLAYAVPFLDNTLDAVATPAAVVAGTVVAASQLTDVNPMVGWTVALVAGGGAAGIVQGLTTVARGISTLATGGFGNPILSIAELGGSLLLTVLAITLPFLAAAAVLVLLFVAAKRLLGRRPRTPSLAAGS